MNNEEKIIAMLGAVAATVEKIQTELTEFKQEMSKFEQETKLEISRIRTQLKENTDFIKAIRHAVEEIDAKTTNKELSIAKLDRLELDVANHEGMFAAIKEAVS